MRISNLGPFRDWRGGPGRLQCRVRRRLTSNALDEDKAALPLPLPNVLEDGVQVIVEASGVSVSYSANFIDNWVVHGSAPNSSSGVQMIGALNPFVLQTSSITGRTAALAKWRQFHVTRLNALENLVWFGAQYTDQCGDVSVRVTFGCPRRHGFPPRTREWRKGPAGTTAVTGRPPVRLPFQKRRIACSGSRLCSASLGLDENAPHFLFALFNTWIVFHHARELSPSNLVAVRVVFWIPNK